MDGKRQGGVLPHKEEEGMLIEEGRTGRLGGRGGGERVSSVWVALLSGAVAGGVAKVEEEEDGEKEKRKRKTKKKKKRKRTKKRVRKRRSKTLTPPLLSYQTVVAPLDRVKLLFQVTPEPFSLGAAVRKTQYLLKTEGCVGLWKGNPAIVARVLPATAVNYASYLHFKRVFTRWNQGELPGWAVDFVAGAGAGVLSTVVTHPFDVLRARLAVEPGRQTVGMVGMAQRMFKESGYRGFYRGQLPAIVGIIPYSGTIWMVNQLLRDRMASSTGRPATVTEKLVCGGVAGLVAQWVTYPLDIVRRRMQVSQLGLLSPNRTITSSLQHLVRTEGTLALFKGFSINWIKGPVASGIRFVIIEAVDNQLKWSYVSN